MSNLRENALVSPQLPGSLSKEQYRNHTDLRDILVPEGISSERSGLALSSVKNESVNAKKSRLIEKIKATIIELVYNSEEQLKINFSDYLSQKLGYHYTYMANLFAKVHGRSIQNFIITTKIKRVKELLIYTDLTLSEISFKLHYSSVAHLSNQFKKVTGSSPSRFLTFSAQSDSLFLPGIQNTHRRQATGQKHEAEKLAVVYSH